ncbi:MAG: tetratricopeptide repeat protein [Pirellulales bacterium]
MSTVDEALAIGTNLHKAGRLAEAEKAYRQVLSVEPGHPHALHQMGLLALQARQFDAAIDLIGRAVRADRRQAAFHANLGEAYRHAGNAAEAAECLRRALKLQPRLPKAHRLLGIVLDDLGKPDEAADAFRQALRQLPDDTETRVHLGIVLEQQGKLAEAETCFRRVLRTDSNSADAHFRLAGVLRSQERLDEAAASYRAAIALKPDHPEAHNNLGTILKDQEHLDEAESHYQTAISLKPEDPAPHINLGLLQENQERLDEAAASFGKAIEVDPQNVLARHSLALVLQKQGKLLQAEAAFQEAIRIDPTYSASHMSLGYLYQMQGQAKQAIACCQEVIRLDPNCAEAYNNMGVAWAGEGRHDETIVYCRRAIELRGDFSTAHSNLAVSLQALGQLDEAIEHHRRAVELPDAAASQHSNLLYSMNYHPGFDAATLFAEHRAWGARWADPLTAGSSPHANDRRPDRRLRVGYVSAHFRSHAVNFFTEPILASHDHSAFEVYCYSDVSGHHADETTRRLRGYADHWRDTLGQTDEHVSELVRGDRIDILVDLTGHINGGNRMLVFARKPAPIQVTYIGYQNTTGMLAMDYRLTDEYADPPGATDALHTEKLVRLPTTFFCYQPSGDAPAVGELPAAANGHVTFGSVNNFTKITVDALRLWAEILLRVPGSRLVIRADMTESLRKRLRETFAEQGIGGERLELVNRLPRLLYLELIKRMDIALDPFPFNGHTTTCDCIWQGVGVVTLSGQTYVSRFGGSGLKTLGLDELIADSREGYLETAVALAQDVERLRRLRATLRERMAASPLLDFAGFTRNLEAAYRRMWHDWLAEPSSR